MTLMLCKFEKKKCLLSVSHEKDLTKEGHKSVMLQDVTKISERSYD